MESYGKFARIYDALMADVDYDAWADYIKGLLAEDVKTVVDCACGTGAIALRLAQAGYNIIGIDASEEMLRIAAEKARKMGKRIPWICQDMRALVVHKPVDAIVCACDGVN